MKKEAKIKRGRPLKGDLKRVRTSFTLPPDQVGWLEKQAGVLKTTKSDLLTRIITDSQYFKSDVSSVTRMRFPISEKTLRRFCNKYYIIKFALFGSVLGNRFGPESDIDVLVEFDSEHVPSLFDIAAMEKELSNLLDGRKVDIKTSNDLSRYFKEDVVREAEVLYAA